MKSMTVKKVAGRESLFGREVAPFAIDIHPWPETGSGYSPKVEGRLCYSEAGLHIGFTIWENSVIATYTQPNDPVSRDSCVEFFFSPEQEGSAHYVNFEVNAIGTFLAKNRPGPKTMHLIERTQADREYDIRTTLTAETVKDYKGPFWQVSYTVPKEVILRCFPDARLEPGQAWRANFYKCTNGGPTNHQIAWNRIETPTPQFHSPAYFGRILLG